MRRAANINRVKRRLLREAVADNLDTIRGVPPRALRPGRRVWRLLLRRAPLLLVPLTVAGSTWFAASGPGTREQAPPPRVVATKASLVPQRGAMLAASAMPSIDPTPTSASAFPLSVRRVVIDAGHGGNDPGTSALSLTEKEVTLDIAGRLRTLLQQNGFEVIVTRGDDRLVALRERARLANSSEGDIFVSIHVNSLQTHTASHGVETYFLGPTSDPSLTTLAAAENRLSGYSINDMRKLLDRLYADVRRDESRRLAGALQQQMFANLRGIDPGLENWGVKRAPFVVLVATEMPAVLAEVGCMSNDREAAMLGRPDYRQQIAAALFQGISQYAREKSSAS